MNTPPNPGIPALLLATAAKMSFRITIGARGPRPELGVLHDDFSGEKPLLLAAGDRGAVVGGGNCVTWALEADKACIPFVFDRGTYLVLHEGTLSETGAVLWQGRGYRIEAQWNGFYAVAVAVPW